MRSKKKEKKKRKLPKKEKPPVVETTALPAKGNRFKVGARWSPRLAKDGFVPIVNGFLEHYNFLKPYHLTHSEAMFVIHLIRYKWDESAPFPGYKTIAKQMGVSHKSARRYAYSLVKKNYLVLEKRIGDTNKFHLGPLIAALERHLDERSKKS